MTELIRKQGLLIDEEKRSWEDAVRICGGLMLSLGSVTKEYIDAMVAAVHDLGPFIVIAPHIAFAHAAAGAHVLKNDLVLVVFREPIIFGSDNDPVHLMFGLSALEPGSHLELLQRLAVVLEGGKISEKLMNAATVEALYGLINTGYLPSFTFDFK